MATLRQEAQRVLDVARDGIGWIALWKEGRGWSAAAFWPDYDERDDRLTIEADDLAELTEILEKDPSAIFVNSYIHNIGGMEDITREDLAAGLHRQYEHQSARLADYLKTQRKEVTR